ncbi:MAG TPA: serine/threonine-protein kinase, partial [Acidobacteriota bacterium]|nr:serine/threonine-protein kinase [Acidobacteriota bacterium]
MATQSPNEPFRTMGNFIIGEKLGEGNLGPVYGAIDQRLGRAAVIRILDEGIKWTPGIEAVFRRECDAVAALRHPNIAAIYEIGGETRPTYLAMEALESRNLTALIARNADIPVEVKLAIAIQTAEGLRHAHDKGVLHLDLCPAKIHITGQGCVKIRDFAITHVLMMHLPKPAVRWGAPIYLSPEQVENKAVDERSDIFSIGTVFYEFFTGLHPFHDPNGNKALDNIVFEISFPTFEQFPELPPGIWAILKTCLARNPQDRYLNMSDLAAALHELAESLEEDNRMALAELFGSLHPLRKAAAKPYAPEKIGSLLNEIQELARSGHATNYTRLKRLMSDLIDQQEFIRSAANETPETIVSQFFSEPRGAPAGTADDPAAGPVSFVPERKREMAAPAEPSSGAETANFIFAGNDSTAAPLTDGCFSAINPDDPAFMALDIETENRQPDATALLNYPDGERVSLVYDTEKVFPRPMSEADESL